MKAFCVLLLCTCLHLSLTATDTIAYTITIDAQDPLRVDVHAVLPVPVDTLFIHPFCPSYDFPEGWSTFILRDGDKLSYLGSARWIAPGQTEISYSVDLSFVQKEWAAGNEQAGKQVGNAIFLVTRPLFLAPASEAVYTVNFDLPQGHRVSAPWVQLPDASFVVHSRDGLMNNTLVWGRHAPVEITDDDFTLEIAMLGYEQSVQHLIKETFTPILRHFRSLFPGTPRTRYLITVFPHRQNDGEAYTTSNAFTLKFPPGTHNKLSWANQFAHELFHYWNGKLMNGPERADRQWFSEGYTEYYANLALLKEGLISQKEFFGLIEKTIGLYYFFRERQYSDISLMQAGDRKSRHRFGVYNGGWCAAFVMDMMIREKFPDKTLDDFMQMLFRDYGITRKPYVCEDLEHAFKDFMGDQGNTFFEKYIYGLEVLPVEECMAKAGLLLDYTAYEGTAFIFPMEKTTTKQDELLERWLGQPVAKN